MSAATRGGKSLRPLGRDSLRLRRWPHPPRSRTVPLRCLPQPEAPADYFAHAAHGKPRPPAEERVAMDPDALFQPGHSVRGGDDPVGGDVQKPEGLKHRHRTLHSWLYLPWVIKPLWSPLVDLFRTKRFWIVCLQFVVGASLALVALTVPGPGFFAGPSRSSG